MPTRVHLLEHVLQGGGGLVGQLGLPHRDRRLDLQLVRVRLVAVAEPEGDRRQAAVLYLSDQLGLSQVVDELDAAAERLGARRVELHVLAPPPVEGRSAHADLLAGDLHHGRLPELIDDQLLLLFDPFPIRPVLLFLFLHTQSFLASFPVMRSQSMTMVSQYSASSSIARHLRLVSSHERRHDPPPANGS